MNTKNPFIKNLTKDPTQKAKIIARRQPTFEKPKMPLPPIPKEIFGDFDKEFQGAGVPSVQEDEEAKKQIEQLKAQDEAKTKQMAVRLRQELEGEIEKWRKIRAEREQQRKVLEEQAKQQAVQEKGEVQAAPEVSSKRPRGDLFGFIGQKRRIKQAQEQAQPETVGKRVGG